MAKITMTKPSNSGVALGGIGTGSVELLPDGEFHYWQVANPKSWASVSRAPDNDDSESGVGALSFWIRTKTADGKPIIRKLGMKTDPEDFTYRMFGWNKPVERIEYDGKFPVCDLDYIDRGLPCKLHLRAVSPFVPHQSDIAATPGFYLEFTVENTSDKEQTVSLLGTLIPEFADREYGMENELVRFGNAVGVFSKSLEPEEWPRGYQFPANYGNLCFTVSGDGESTYVVGEYDRYLREYITWSPVYGVTQESILFDFRESGHLPNSTVGKKPRPLPLYPEDLTDEALDRIIAEYTALPWGASVLEHIRHTYPDFPSTREEKETMIPHLAEQVGNLKGSAFGASALANEVTLAPGESAKVRFVLSWHFPFHRNPDGKVLGHYYETLYENAAASNKFLVENPSVFDRAAALTDLLFTTDLPEVYPEAWSSQLETVVKGSWYLKDGKFGLWEGLSYCGFHTTDITYHASFGLLALFPDLQKKQMKMGAAFQREDGRVHHFFTPDLEHVDNGFDRVDMNPQLVLMVLRDYLFTGDKAYLTDLWPHVTRAMDSIAELDQNGDGLPDTGTKRNTYDAWNFSGTPTYISVLWLAALKAAVMIARRVGDDARAKAWAETLEKGKASLETLLWNGSYYNLWRDDTQTDESLMTDQLDGEWFLRMMGIGGNLPDERVRAVLEVIYAENFDHEAGLVNATCPEGKSTSLATYENCQAEAVWTGIGYLMAAMAMAVGRRDLADMGVQSIYDNQASFGALWDHWECGHHYTRPMSSWTTLNAALGLFVDAENRNVRLNPIAKDITLPLVLPDALAVVTVRDGICELKCVEGNLNDWSIVCKPVR
ncbi:MAG: hypothetical protein IJC93_03740 [Clostridia bacterium]|nr:hypothetical protein [Clostridia bacterium]